MVTHMIRKSMKARGDAATRIAAAATTTETDDATVTAPASEEAAEGKVFLRKRELIDRVVTESGMKKKDVKPVVEAMLAVLGNALSDGEVLNVNPLGKISVNRRKELSNGEVLTARIRRVAVSEEPVKEALAEPGE
ncbi:HU family DNA-binding protein [Actibacterium sp. D379-3]